MYSRVTFLKMAVIIHNIIIIILFFNCSYTSADSTSAYDKLTKIENASNIFIGHKHIQKIKAFYIDDDIVCTDKHLPIIFHMHSENETVDARGWLTEHGNVVEHQENSSNCHLFKK